MRKANLILSTLTTIVLTLFAACSQPGGADPFAGIATASRVRFFEKDKPVMHLTFTSGIRMNSKSIQLSKKESVTMGRKFMMVLQLFSILFFQGCSITPGPVTLIDYPMAFATGDGLACAFYITSYPGTSLSQVTVYFTATNSGSYTMQLEARDSAFNGGVIGQATASLSGVAGISDYKATVFDFGNLPVTKGSVVTFQLSVIGGSGGGTVYFCNQGTVTGTPLVQETNDNTPPLSTNRFGAIAIKVVGQN